MSTFHSGWKPRATVSLVSVPSSTRSHSTAHTEDSLHQQPRRRVVGCRRIVVDIEGARDARAIVHEGVDGHRIVEHHGAEGVAEAFAERHADVEPVAETVRAADVVGAREVGFDVMAELVRDYVLIEFVGIFGGFGRQHDELRSLAHGEIGLSTGIVIGPVEHQLGKVHVVGAALSTSCTAWYTVSRIANGADARVPVTAPALLKPDGISMSWPVPALELNAWPSV